jgi:hypothetical protein
VNAPDRKRYLLRPSSVVSKSDGEVHHIGAAELARLHGVDVRRCVVIPEGEEWPRGMGPLHTEALREAAGLKLLTPSYHGNYGVGGWDERGADPDWPSAGEIYRLLS